MEDRAMATASQLRQELTAQRLGKQDLIHIQIQRARTGAAYSAYFA
jgi:hypothetical protein